MCGIQEEAKEAAETAPALKATVKAPEGGYGLSQSSLLPVGPQDGELN
jgi:hypothetical protein